MFVVDAQVSFKQIEFKGRKQGDPSVAFAVLAERKVSLPIQVDRANHLPFVFHNEP